jgi:hypothetical protein
MGETLCRGKDHAGLVAENAIESFVPSDHSGSTTPAMWHGRQRLSLFSARYIKTPRHTINLSACCVALRCFIGYGNELGR